jgi:uncharacterized OsmC-like protein
MKVLVELEITGDFDQDLDEDKVEEIVDMVIDCGCESYCLYGTANIKQILEY